MFDVLRFIFRCVIQFCEMLFTIDVGFSNLGSVMCVVFIILPLMLVIVDFLKASSGDVSFALFSSRGGKKK